MHCYGSQMLTHRGLLHHLYPLVENKRFLFHLSNRYCKMIRDLATPFQHLWDDVCLNGSWFFFTVRPLKYCQLYSQIEKFSNFFSISDSSVGGEYLHQKFFQRRQIQSKAYRWSLMLFTYLLQYPLFGVQSYSLLSATFTFACTSKKLWGQEKSCRNTYHWTFSEVMLLPLIRGNPILEKLLSDLPIL